jgi:hypothetical protein
MNWDAIGAVAELTGALGVILSLVYLAFQIRLNSKQIEQNSNFVESTLYQSVGNAMLSWHTIIAQDQDVAKIWQKIRTGKELTKEERAQAWSLVAMLFVSMGGQQQHYRNGVMSRAPLEQEQLGLLLKSPYITYWVDKHAPGSLSPEFVTELNHFRKNCGNET